MDIHTINFIDACSGIGQLGEAFRVGLAAFGVHGRCVCHIERDAAAAAALVARMEAEEVGRTPIWDDLATFDGLAWRGRVDAICAGLPCQPYSAAGMQRGNSDRRSHGEDGSSGPIPHFLRIVAECQPGLVFMENVPPWVRGGFYEPVWRELRRLGYTRQEAIFVSAADAGYPHQRERVFVLAVSEQWRRWVVESLGRPDWRASAGRTDQELADPALSVGRPRAERDGVREAGVSVAGKELAHAGHRRVGAQLELQLRERDPGSRESGEGVADGQGFEAGLGYVLADPRQGGSQHGPSGRVEGVADSRRDGDQQRHDTGGVVGVDRAGEVEGPERQWPRNHAGDGDDTVRDASARLEGLGDSDVQPERESRDGSGLGASPMLGARGRQLPLHPPPRGTDLAEVAEVIAKIAAEDLTQKHFDGIDYFGHPFATARRHAAAAARMARGIWRDWETVARLEPTLMPSVESGVPMVVDGHPFSAADLLRLGGNCVVADSAARAMVALWIEMMEADQ